MISNVYKVIFNKSISELDEDYERFSDREKLKISEIEADSLIDYNTIFYTFFIITTPMEIQKFFDILSDNQIKFKYNNISDDILYKKYDILKELNENVDKEESIKISYFTEDIKEWISNNLEIDIVLDRISEVGMSGLSEIENNFLKNYKK